jgi:hypothetical protein
MRNKPNCREVAPPFAADALMAPVPGVGGKAALRRKGGGRSPQFSGAPIKQSFGALGICHPVSVRERSWGPPQEPAVDGQIGGPTAPGKGVQVFALSGGQPARGLPAKIGGLGGPRCASPSSTRPACGSRRTSPSLVMNPRPSL